MEVDFTDKNKEPTNTTLGEVISAKDTKMKKWIVNYVGKKAKPKNEEVTVQMVVETLAEEFPELVLPLAEENYIRGYQQAMEDVETGEKILQEIRDSADVQEDEE
jgi:myosin heavy subunit